MRALKPAVLVLAFLTAGFAAAKLPAPTEANKEKAAAAKLKAAKAGTREAEALSRAQERVAERYRREKAGSKGAALAAPASAQQ